MRSLFLSFTTLAVVCMSAGCATEPSSPPVDLDAEKAAIEQLLGDWLESTNQPGEAGAEGYVSFVTDDVVVLPPNEERAEGREEARNFVQGFTENKGWWVSWEADQVEVASAGDLAYVIGAYELGFTDDEGNPVEDRGKFLDTLQKQPDGTWRVSAVSFNSDLPAGGATEEGATTEEG